MSTTNDFTPHIEAATGSPAFERILNIVGAMLAGAADDQKSDALDPELHSAMTVAAAAVAAGYIAGAMIVAGTAMDRDRRRIEKMVLTNFRHGIALGKANVVRSPSAGDTVQ